MGFVNEFASEEDVKKYDLDGLWKQYKPLSKLKFKEGHGMFTIDRERNIFFMTYLQGREESSNRTTGLLWFNGKCVVVEIDKVDGVKNNPEGIKSSPYIITWELVNIYSPKTFEKSNEIIIQVLKEILTTYGLRGAHRQVPNTVVEFKF